MSELGQSGIIRRTSLVFGIIPEITDRDGLNENFYRKIFITKPQVISVILK